MKRILAVWIALMLALTGMTAWAEAAETLPEADAQAPQAEEAAEDERFTFSQRPVTIGDLQEHDIGPHEGSYMDKETLAYLIYYGEQYCVDEKTDEYAYIFTPDPRDMSPEEIREFAKTRAYIEKTLTKRVEVLYGE